MTWPGKKHGSGKPASASLFTVLSSQFLGSASNVHHAWAQRCALVGTWVWVIQGISLLAAPTLQVTIDNIVACHAFVALPRHILESHHCPAHWLCLLSKDGPHWGSLRVAAPHHHCVFRTATPLRQRSAFCSLCASTRFGNTLGQLCCTFDHCSPDGILLNCMH